MFFDKQALYFLAVNLTKILISYFFVYGNNVWFSYN